MSWKQYRIVVIVFATFGIAVLPSCGHEQSLQSITVRPSGFVFEGVGAQGQFTAVGNYIHPPESKDITDQVLWKIDVANLATVSSTGLATALNTCGSGNVTATVYSNPKNPSDGSIIIGSATVKGVLDGTPACQ
ncbi:MAG TPA: Ig-like domain-containing protein [Terriglobales bacterium]|nr:Ig-like domain-containing protein [Terriglobales bacterium]